MSTVLADVIGRGVTGSRPAAGVAGRLYYDTTASILYRDNGATWDSVEGAGGLADMGVFTYLDATGAAAPGNPASGKARIYAKTDGRIYSRDSAGVEYGPFDAAGTGRTQTFYVPVNEVASGNGNVSSITLTVPVPTVGNHLRLGSGAEGAANISSIVQTNVTWSKVKESAASTAPHAEVWKGIYAGSGTMGTSIVITYSGLVYVWAFVCEYPGATCTLDQFAVVTNSASHNIPVITPDAAAAVFCVGANSTYGGDFSCVSPSVYPFRAAMPPRDDANHRLAVAWGFPGAVAISGSFPNGHGGNFSGVSVSFT